MNLYAFKKYKKEKLRIEYQKLYAIKDFDFDINNKIKIINRLKEIQNELNNIDTPKKIKKIRKERI